MAAAREWTGRGVFAVTAGAFGIIIAVNGILAWQAVRSFPGLEVANSYVASQSFDAERQAQEALGWTLSTDYAAGSLRLTFRDKSGAVVPVQDLDVLVGRTTEARDDVRPAFTAGPGGLEAALTLPPGRWMLQVSARSEAGTQFRQRLTLTVKG